MNKPKDRISVVLLCKDQHENLPLILHALSHQTKKPDEVIIVDDRSKTDTSSLAERFECRYFSTNLYAQGKDGARALARQLGTEGARFDLIVYLDGDIVPSRRFVEIGCKWALNNTVAKAPRRYRISMQGQTIQSPTVDMIDRRISFSSFFSDSFVIKRGSVFDIGGWDEHFEGWGGEDVEFAYRLEMADIPIVMVNNSEFYGTHIDHPVNHEANFRSLTKNANYFVAKHEAIREIMGEYWNSMNIFLATYAR